MQFHLAKCQVLSITESRQVIHYIYTFHCQNVKQVNTAKYLGIKITHDLCSNQHIINIAQKTTRIL